MNARDRLWLSSRHIRGRLVESILVILATAVGVALVAAMTAFIRSYNVQTDYLLSHPAYRELVVEVVGNETELTEPVVAFDPTTVQEIRLDVEDLRLAKESVPAVSYGYIAEREMLFRKVSRGARRGEPGGAGLGLAIVASVATAHEGRVFAEPRDGGGSRFGIAIPQPAELSQVMPEI